MNKTITILLTTLLPLLSLGQNSSNTNLEFERKQMCQTSTELEKQIETTLINDVKLDKTILNFDLNKSYSLTLASINTYKIDTNRIFEFDKLQKGIRSLKNNKTPFSSHLR